MKKIILLFILVLCASHYSFALGPIDGSTTLCVGSSNEYAEYTTGGTWTTSSSNIAITGTSGTIDSSFCTVSGVSAGTAVLTYTLGSSIEVITITIGAAPAAITGGGVSFCVGASATLSDATTGGTWSSGSSAATVTSGGVVTGVSGGVADIYYTASGGGCSVSTTVTVNATAISDSVDGPDGVCAGSTITLTNATSGGTWSSTDVSVATVVASTGVVTGIAAGTANISYSVSGSCGVSSVGKTITVSSTTSPGTITGSSIIYIGSTTTLSGVTSGGYWTSSNAAVAAIGSSTGVVSGVAAGTATISYSVTGCGGLSSVTMPVTVSLLNRISGNVNFYGPDSAAGTIKVWLITYNTTSLDLEAIDSVTLSTGSGYAASYAYQFLGEPTDSFRVKAAYFPGTTTTTGYIPTYYTSSFYWHDADVFYHTGTADDGKNINMLYGATTSGPGFISGDVTTGANRGTSATVPAVGLQIYLLNASGTLIQQTQTDAAGNYSFSSLPVGTTYTVFPEALGYSTIAYTSISLTSSAPSMTSAAFEQHSLSHTITPSATAVAAVTKASLIVVFPNPTTGNIFIQWSNKSIGNADVTISDLAGRTVLSSTININAASGQSQLNVNDLNNGIYFISIKGAGVNYNGKVMVQH